MAATALVAQYHDPIYGLALRMLRNREDAAEVAQDAMVRALSRLGDYDTSRPFAPWIFRIARNLCIDRHRRKRPSSQLNEEVTAAIPADEGGTRFARRQDKVVQQNELNRALDEAMADLGDKYREVIELYHYKHLSYRQIADQLELPEGTVMNRLFRARKKLELLLRERGIQR